MDALPDSRAAGLWPEDSVARVPYWVYQDEANYKRELERLFEGATWNFVCLEAEIPDKGDWRTNHVGALPVIVVRDADGAINCFENRCAHRGALIALDEAGTVESNFKCIYHAWSYDLCGNLRGIAFERGINGVGGMPRDFSREAFAPRKLRTTTLCGLVFATLSPDTPPIEEFIGADVLGRIRRVLDRPIRVMGRFTQALPNNWKLYVENVKDTYHASLLHLFFGTFRITRLTQGGGVLVSPDGGSHSSYTIDKADDARSTAYRDQGIRTEKQDYKLADPRLLDTVDEFKDGIRLQILSVFPAFILQQIHNCLAVRQVVPRGIDAMDLKWTYFGFADDPPEMTARRLRQQNLVGPAGFVSMEDGCVGGFVQRGIAAAGDQVSAIEMGGRTTESQATRATEASVRGFWKAYRRHMGY
ncbi:aromatic ring-hydroxylating dioxygenase subunit alpha [Enhydrobacter sp.]|jgi:anthranilate 1,2-dioxygenase large subunit/terephthalate 1,2-dioxygenase oxygenase component alpha subunit|uniref:aromatic ring-hydroxylating dioxygenase subunit alpha n=1 Tax=Enhydrobacter sp. TaxID=1894999 RepID=UPI0026122C7E|nr:aromatic ring-hydroxylating dioxygenase subunit alpha [Enhydrobacter sp.]WIM14466.1 MAG: Ortho-halobenzoate 1,2-dioxygenase alpha-ISP protein OhbB [Enhydrobacter sp.]